MQNQRSYAWFPLCLLWFGAAMSVAEIQTGGLLASADPGPGLAALLAGHLVGATLLGLMGLMGFREGTPSLVCTRISFGRQGSWLLSLANMLQLMGWTAVMIQQNSQALGGITRNLWGVELTGVSILALGGLVALWAFWESRGQHSGNVVAVILLALLGLLTTWVLWRHPGEAAAAHAPAGLSFGEAFELSLIMPLSWVPLVADYACRAKSARAACLAPALGYFCGSVWMYGLGFAGAILTGKADPSPMLMAAGLGTAALSVLVFSTVVTTFLDVYSAVASARNIVPNLPEKTAGLAVVAIGTGAAMFWDSSVYVNFLHCIGAVFAPLSAIIFTDYFLLRADERDRAVSLPGLFSLGAGIAGYVLFSYVGSPLGPTFACLLLTLAVHFLSRKYLSRLLKADQR